jgi:excisionase family DNA binding protein
LTVDEVADLFKVKPRTVYRWLKSGQMKGIKTPGGQHRIPAESVRAEFESRLVEPDPRST